MAGLFLRIRPSRVVSLGAAVSRGRQFSSQAFEGAAAEAYAIIFESAAPSWHKHISVISGYSNAKSAIEILDVGSGPGEPACTFAAEFPSAKVTCTDISADMIEKAKKRAESKGVQLDFGICGGDDLSQFADSSFDYVTMNMTLMFVPDRVKCLQECARVLKPEGKVLSTAWKANAFMAGIGKSMAKLLAPDPTPPPPPINPMALAAENAQEDLAAEAGLTVAQSEIYDLTMYMPSEQVARAAVMIPMGPKLKEMEEKGRNGAAAEFQDIFMTTAPEVGILKDDKGGYPIVGKHQMIVLRKA